MIFLLGLMGAFAVGATALVWYEISSRTKNTGEEADIVVKDDTDSGQHTKESHATDISAQVDHIDELLAAAADLAAGPQTEHDAQSAPKSETSDETESQLRPGADQSADLQKKSSPALTAIETHPANETPISDVLEVHTEAATAQDAVVSTEADTALPFDDLVHGVHQDNVRGFVPNQDKLIVVFDDTADAFPVVGLVFEEGADASAHVTLNGERITTVHAATGLTLDHITLVPESSLGHGIAA